MGEKFGGVVEEGEGRAGAEVQQVQEGIGLSNQTREIQVDTNLQHDIMTPTLVAQFLRKTPSWVYKNWQLHFFRGLTRFSHPPSPPPHRV